VRGILKILLRRDFGTKFKRIFDSPLLSSFPPVSAPSPLSLSLSVLRFIFIFFFHSFAGSRVSRNRA